MGACLGQHALIATVLRISLRYLRRFQIEDGQAIERHPEWDMAGRNILRRIDDQNHTLDIAARSFPLRDTFLPTIDPADPNRLSEEEEECMRRIEESFTTCPRLWEPMKWMANYGQMPLVHDHAAIFHACLPVDEHERYVALNIDGRDQAGPETHLTLGLRSAGLSRPDSPAEASAPSDTRLSPG